MRITHSWTGDSATIRFEVLTKSIRMLHLTETHVALIVDTISPNAVQYVTAPGFEGRNRMVEFQPLP